MKDAERRQIEQVLLFALWDPRACLVCFLNGSLVTIFGCLSFHLYP